MTKTILVTGGTGMVGRLVVDRLAAEGHAVRVLSRRAPEAVPGAAATLAADLRSGGPRLAAAVEGADTVVHLASTPTGGDTRSAANLFGAARRAEVPHVVLISIAGVDRSPLPYYRTKLRVEQALADSGLGWTLLRTTQFHGLVQKICALLAKAPLAVVPLIPLQPVDAGEVADRLVALATREPAGRAADFGGPRVATFPDLMRCYLRWSGRRRPLMPAPLPGRTMAAFRAGRHLAPAVGRIGFEEFLAARRPHPRRGTEER
ncbi:uncharacterized protein YbjT (DUF2867 family) [Murinocardiopsis flavida]|uniref:Uncharacterized protein YbjT (DUF2867 family) n=1 Tax=Murinocardiopsis flavida TaxID=645275 RepID=A0A2P8DKL7_9ACTN|nr:NAD(P)H-binding protein [Murinocardiopsis flavida]PSK97772.1 uncharacterized protein YbjT (DUF2867 family) [Murinocardiopsis flavida]